MKKRVVGEKRMVTGVDDEEEDNKVEIVRRIAEKK